MASIHLVTEVAAPPEACFDAARSVTVHVTSWPAHRAIAGVTSGTMELGDEVTWLARHFGVGWRMTSRIVEYERPHRFVDEMQRGPFGRWRHEHRFIATPQGTQMIDSVEFASPFGLLGKLVDATMLEQYMIRLLRRHNDNVRAAAERHASVSTSPSSADLPPTESSHRLTRREN